MRVSNHEDIPFPRKIAFAREYFTYNLFDVNHLGSNNGRFFAPQPSVIERKVTPERKHERMAEAQGGEA